MNPYEILGIEKNATQEDIKKAYRKLSMKHHPDRNGNSSESNKIFQNITDAYSQIDTEEKRKNLQLFHNSNMNADDISEELLKFFMQTQNPSNKLPTFFFSNLQSEFMNQMQSPLFKSFQKPPPIVKKIRINFELSFKGGQLPIEIEREILTGTSKEKEKETIYIKIPEGIDNNEMIIIREKGNIVNELRGDIKIFVVINPHENFTREGLNLLYTQKVTLKQALCGFSIDLPYINGKTIKIKNDMGNIIKPNFEKSISKLGFRREGHCGNLIITFNIEFPIALTNECMHRLNEILP